MSALQGQKQGSAGLEPSLQIGKTKVKFSKNTLCDKIDQVQIFYHNIIEMKMIYFFSTRRFSKLAVLVQSFTLIYPIKNMYDKRLKNSTIIYYTINMKQYTVCLCDLKIQKTTVSVSISKINRACFKLFLGGCASAFPLL